MRSGFSLLALAGTLALACNSVRRQECEKFLAAMKPLDEGRPSADTVERVRREVGAIAFQDQPLGIFAKNYAATLTILANTLELEAGPTPPDGTDDVIKQNLKSARTDRDDVQRYCSQ